MKLSKVIQSTLIGVLASLTLGFTYAHANESDSDTMVMYYHHDVRGDPVVVTDSSGSILWLENYRAYGASEPRVSSAGIGFGDNSAAESNNRLGYTGHERDGSSGLTYMKARYYDNLTGRFLSNDPVGFTESNPMMFNRYTYANNNPYTYTDPDGREPIRRQVASPADFISLYEEHFNKPEDFVTLLSSSYNNDLYESARYLYTKERGYIDMKHFAASFAHSHFNGRTITKFLGKAKEFSQHILGRRSAYSYEDFPSNNAGLDFADKFSPGVFSANTFLQSLQEFFNGAGALGADHPDNPRDSLPERERDNPPVNLDPNSTTTNGIDIQ